MKKLCLTLLAVAFCALSGMAAVTGIRVSALTYTNASPELALLIVDQKYAGRTTNDTFNTTISNLFTARASLSVSNLLVTGKTTWFTKSQRLSLGTNVLAAGNYSQWSLISPSSDPTAVTIALNNGSGPVQHLEIFNLTNAVPASGAFTLYHNSDIPDSLSGGKVLLLGGRNWVATNGAWIQLRFVSPDWVETDDRNIFTGAGGADLWASISGVLQNVDLSTANGSPVVSIKTYNTHTFGNLFEAQNNGTNRLFLDYSGALNLVDSTDGSQGIIKALGNITSIKGVSGASFIDSLGSGNEVRWTDNRLWPLSQHSYIGGDNNTGPRWPVGIVNSETNYSWGFVDTISTNWSRLATYHTGTNGNATFNSQSSGIAGDPRPFVWQTNGVEIASLVQNGSYNLFRVSRGGDSVILGVGNSGAAVIESTGSSIVLPWNNGSSQVALSDVGILPFPNDTLSLGTSSFRYDYAYVKKTVLTGITKAEKTGLSPENGMLVYQTDNTPGLRAYVNGAWVIVLTAVDP